MIELLGVVLSVAIPAALAYGSSSRRRLTILRDEIKVYNEVPDSSSAKKVLYAQINRTADEYQVYRAQAGRMKLVAALMALMSITYLAGFSAFFLLIDTSLARALIETADTRHEVGKALAVVAVLSGIILSIVMTVISANRRHRVTRLERGRGKKNPKDEDLPPVSRSMFASDEQFERAVKRRSERNEEHREERREERRSSRGRRAD